MYKIIYTNTATGIQFTEYGFGHYMAKRICFIMNNWEDAEIDWFLPLVPTVKTFWKCFTKKIFCKCEKST